VAIDAPGNFYVTLENTNKIREFAPSRQFVREITGRGLSEPQGLAFGRILPDITLHDATRTSKFCG
jgi:hypothetical protein